MDFKAFYGVDVVEWIAQANQMAMKHGMDHVDFWKWVANSCGAICEKYQDHRLVINSMMMLTEWLEDAYKSKVGKD